MKSTANVAHTSEAWTIHDGTVTHLDGTVGGNLIIRTPRGQVAVLGRHQRSDANLIVRAVNSHAAMLEAAKILIESLKWEEKRSGTTYNGYEELQAAIAQAEGQ